MAFKAYSVTAEGKTLTIFADTAAKAKLAAKRQGWKGKMKAEPKSNPSVRKRNITYQFTGVRRGTLAEQKAIDKRVKESYGKYELAKSKEAKAKNPSIPKGKFIKCKAVKFNRNGSISIKK
jgi:hypothetical protein